MTAIELHQSQTGPGHRAEQNHSMVAIVGSGFSGLAMARALKREGIRDFVVLERAGGLGGNLARSCGARPRGGADRAVRPRRGRPVAVRGHCLPLRGLEPRPRPARRASRRHRHGCVRHPVRAMDPTGGLAALCLPANGPVDPPPLRPPHHAPRTIPMAGDTPLPAPVARGRVRRTRVSCRGAGARATTDESTRTHGKVTPSSSGTRHPVARSTDSQLPLGVQAHPDLKRLLLDALRAQCDRGQGRPERSSEPLSRGTDGVEREVDTIIFGTGFHVTNPPHAGYVRGATGSC